MRKIIVPGTGSREQRREQVQRREQAVRRYVTEIEPGNQVNMIGYIYLSP